MHGERRAFVPWASVPLAEDDDEIEEEEKEEAREMRVELQNISRMHFSSNCGTRSHREYMQHSTFVSIYAFTLSVAPPSIRPPSIRPPSIRPPSIRPPFIPHTKFSLSKSRHAHSCHHPVTHTGTPTCSCDRHKVGFFGAISR